MELFEEREACEAPEVPKKRRRRGNQEQKGAREAMTSVDKR